MGNSTSTKNKENEEIIPTDPERVAEETAQNEANESTLLDNPQTETEQCGSENLKDDNPQTETEQCGSENLKDEKGEKTDESREGNEEEADEFEPGEKPNKLCGDDEESDELACTREPPDGLSRLPTWVTESYQRGTEVSQHMTEVFESDLKAVKPDIDGIQETAYEGQEWYNFKESLITKGKETAFKMLQDLCEQLKSDDASIISVWPTYRNINREKPVFLALTNNKGNNFGWFKGFEVIYVDHKSERSNESKNIIHLQKKFSEKDEKCLSACIRTFAEDLMNNHCNLSVISASSFKSEGFGKPEARLVNKPCIVLHCMWKGYIPFMEEPFPKTIGEFDVDVREGTFELAAGEKPPIEFQPELRYGAAISAIGKRSLGSIGPIFDHPRDGYTGFGTNAHVFLTDEEIMAFGADKIDLYTSFKAIQVEQPPGSGFDCGCVVKTVIREGGNGKAGVDACIVKITDRWPNCGYFPEHEENKLHVAGFSAARPPRFDGMIEFDVEKWRNQDLLKYGCMTRLTRGVLHLQSAFVRRCIFNAKHGRCSFKLCGQFEILPVSLNEDSQTLFPFAEPGDSGSLVYSRNENDDLRAIGVVSGVTDYGTTIVTPIRDYLEALDMSDLTTFKRFPSQQNNNTNRFHNSPVRTTSGVSSSQDTRCINISQHPVANRQSVMSAAEDDTLENPSAYFRNLSSEIMVKDTHLNDKTYILPQSVDNLSNSITEQSTEMTLTGHHHLVNETKDTLHRDDPQGSPKFSSLDNNFIKLESSVNNGLWLVPSMPESFTELSNRAGENIAYDIVTQKKDQDDVLQESENEELFALNGVNIELDKSTKRDNVQQTENDNDNMHNFAVAQNGPVVKENNVVQHQNNSTITTSFQIIKEITADTMNKSCEMAINDRATTEVKKTLIHDNTSLGKTAVKEIGNITVASLSNDQDTYTKIDRICPKCGRKASHVTRRYSQNGEINNDFTVKCPNCNHSFSLEDAQQQKKRS